MTKQDTFPLYTHQKLVPDYYSNYYIITTSHLKLILQEKKQKQKWVISLNKKQRKQRKKQELKKNFNKDFCSSWKTKFIQQNESKWIRQKQTCLKKEKERKQDEEEKKIFRKNRAVIAR